jgi:hypothetical protein
MIKMFDRSLVVVVLVEKKRKEHRLLVEKLEGKRALGRPRRRWMDNIKMDNGEI